ncbi:MAG: DUF898 domain-containing protein [Campylobacteraceae bacterium]|jgi:uncharacterized membrane protein YjgN (DUF898 family)|nr:DUF898 domain-containing protein [Campylobacteraceae bacterium]
MNIENSNNPQILKNTPFEFRGNALDFFAIWFVNVVLTIITLGIYGAWAKVRNNQYIYGNTFLGNHSFEYTANPVKILIGRLIVLGVYAVFFTTYLLGYFQAAFVILALFVLLMPLLIRQALIFRAKYTRFHGLNFRYKATVGDFYKFFLLHGFLNLITIFIIFPFTYNRFKKLLINNTYYGNSNLSFYGGAEKFFFVYYIKTLILSLAFSVILGILIAIAVPLLKTVSPAGAFLMIVVYFAAITFSFVLQGSLDAWIGRVVYNDTSIEEYKMLNEWSAPKLSWIYLSNFFAVVFSLGLLYPWTKIRMIRYKLENMGFETLNLDVFAGQIEQNRSAVGEEAADFFDFDIGF